MKWSYTYLLTLVSFAVLISCGDKNTRADASGSFESTEILVSAETTGRLLGWNVQEGQTVQPGELLGVIDTIQLQLKEVQLEASLRALQSRRPDIGSQLATLHQQLETAQSEKKRFSNLVSANAATQKQLDDINAQIALLTKQYQAQRIALQNSDRSLGDESMALSAQIDQLKDQLRRSHLFSPIEGTVLANYVEKDELVTLGKPMCKIADLSTLYLRAYITNAQLSMIQLGQTVDVVVETGEKGEKTYPGVVSWIASNAEFTPKTVQTRDERSNLVYPVKVRVANDGLIKIGMYGGIRFKTLPDNKN